MDKPSDDNWRADRRVLLGPIEVAGFMASLSEGFRQIGVRAEVLELGTHAFGYQNCALSWRSARWVRQLRDYRLTLRSRTSRLLVGVCESMLRVWLLLVVVSRHREFIWVAGQSILPFNLDLPMIRLAGRQQVMIFLGSDGRPPYLSGIYVSDDVSQIRLRRIKWMSRLVCWRVRWCEFWCNYTVSHAPSAQFHRRPYLDFATMGFPSPARTGSSGAERHREPGGVVKVLHAPSRPAQKGTALIRDAVTQLQAEGIRIDYHELTGASNAEVLQRIQESDLVIDELYSDTAIAGLGSEAAALGVACLVCGYAADWIEQATARIGLPGEHYCAPEEFPSRLRQLVLDPQRRTAAAAGQHAFVAGYWSVEKVARRYQRVLQGDLEADWWQQPGQCRYVYGWGVPSNRLRNFLTAYIAGFGPAALYLPPDSPVEESIQEFVR